MRMAKKLKEDVNLDEIVENFIISSFKTTEPQQTGGTLQAVERAKENREAGKGKKRGLSEYGEKFLKRNELKTRQCVYISGQIHAVISRLVHVIADAHIYDRHIPLVEKLLEREPYPAPQLSIDNSIKDFYAFRPEHFVLENYQCHPSIGKIPVAV